MADIEGGLRETLDASIVQNHLFEWLWKENAGGIYACVSVVMSPKKTSYVALGHFYLGVLSFARLQVCVHYHVVGVARISG